MKHYAIEIIGYGKRRRYCLKEVLPGIGTNPVDGKAYTSEEAARAAARAYGIEVEAVGDTWQLVRL